MEKLLDENLSGEPPRPAFRARVLEDSLEAFAVARRRRVRWRLGVSSAAAVFLAGVSFLLGRLTLPQPAPVPGAFFAAAPDTVNVPTEVVEWMSAARLFRQLGMAERMARAVEHAGKLMPADRVAARRQEGPMVAVWEEALPQEGEELTESGVPAPPSASGGINRVMAHSLGD